MALNGCSGRRRSYALRPGLVFLGNVGVFFFVIDQCLRLVGGGLFFCQLALAKGRPLPPDEIGRKAHHREKQQFSHKGLAPVISTATYKPKRDHSARVSRAESPPSTRFCENPLSLANLSREAPVGNPVFEKRRMNQLFSPPTTFSLTLSP